MADLWLVDLEAVAPALEALERDEPRLSTDDRARAMRAADARERRHRLSAYMALRIVLERAVGPTVRRQAFMRGARGKPHLGSVDTTFSLSHTEGLALIGVAPSGPIGVDLERERTLKMSGPRRHGILAVGAGLAATPFDDNAADDIALLRAWCRIEAFAKAQGHGLAHVLGEAGLRGTGRPQPSPASLEAAGRALARKAGLRVVDLRLPPGLFAAVAAAELPAPPRPRRFPASAAAIRRLAAAPR